LRARYVIDRAHNALLDQLATQGLVGAALWLALVGAALTVGVSRMRTSVARGETAIRVGALGAVLAHLADGQVGIATPMSLALFWLAVALLTGPPWIDAAAAPERGPAPPRADRWWRALALIPAVCLAVFVTWAATRWLLASVSFADGTRNAIAGRMGPALLDFHRSADLAPWLSLPAESAAYAALRLAAGESGPARRLDFLHEADTALTRARSHAMSGATSWALAGQVAFAEARAGERDRLPFSIDAFASALRLRPGDPKLLAQQAWAWLESGDAQGARAVARDAVGRDPGEWLGWAVLARSARVLGDQPDAEVAAGKARGLVPPEGRQFLDALLR